ncbi:MAG: hydroxysqualene dehydroxylase HpnE [Calditrichia bacterium]
MKRELVIIGGGVAGMAAAVEAIARGLHPIILDKNRYLGGRVRSFMARDIRRTIDNGQHVLSAAYTKTLDFLRTIGSIDQVQLQPCLKLRFLFEKNRYFDFQTSALPAPFHFFFPLMKQIKISGIRPADLLHLLWQQYILKPEKFSEMTVSEWTGHCRQSEKIRQLIWNPMSLAILNTPAEEADARLLLSAVQQSFLKSSKMAGFGICRNGLSEIFAHPAERYIVENGGSIYTLQNVKKLIIRNNRVKAVVTGKQQFDAPLALSTVPPYALREIIRHSQNETLSSQGEQLEQFSYNSIMTIYLFLKSSLGFEGIMAPVNTPLQWILPLPEKGQGKGYAVVVSAANSWNGLAAEDILEKVKEEFFNLFNLRLENSHSILAHKIIREKRATIAQTPQSQKWRMQPGPLLDNFYVAGDWTATGLPATIEGAITSGQRAVQQISEKLLS